MSEAFSLKGAVELLLKPALRELDELDKKAKASGKGMEASLQRASTAILKAAGPQVLKALGGVLASIAQQSFELGNQLVDAMARFRGATGASKAEAEQFSRVIGNMWRNGSSDIDTLAATLTKLRQTFGDLGTDTEGIAKSFQDFSKITGGNTDKAITSAANAVRQLGLEAKDVGPLLDLVARGSQVTGVNAAELFRGIGQAQTAFDGLGLSLSEGTAYLAQFQKAGGDANDFVDSYLSLAEASTQATQDQAKAFKELGIAVDSAGRPTGNLGSAFDTIVGKLAKGGAASNDFKVAVLKLFGEDSGRKLIQAFSGIGNGLDDLKGKLENNAGTVAASAEAMETLGERATALWRDAFGETIQAGSDLVVKALNWVLENLGYLIDATQEMGSQFGFAFAEIEKNFRGMADGIGEFWQAQMNILSDAWIGFYQLVLDGIRLLPEQLRGSLDGLEDWLVQAQKDIQGSKSMPEASLLGGVDKFLYNTTDLLTGESVSRGVRNYDASKVDEAAASAAEQATADAKAKAAEKERKAKEALAKAEAAKAEAAKAAARAQVQAVKDSITALEQEMALGKVSEREAVKRYQTILEAARKAKLDKKEIFSLEKSLYDLQKGINEDLRAAAEKRQSAEREMHVAWLKNVKGETAAALQALDYERAKREKTVKDRVKLDAWYGAEQRKIFEEDAERKKEAADKEAEALKKQEDGLASLTAASIKAQQERLDAQGKVLDAQLLGLEQEKSELIRALTEQRDEIIKANGDKLKAENAYQTAVLDAERSLAAKRKKILDDDALARKNIEADVQREILRLKAQAIAAEDPEKAAKLTGQADRSAKLQSVQKRAQELKKGGVSDAQIQQYLQAEADAILADKPQEQAPEQKPDTYSQMSGGAAESDANAGSSLPSFSLQTGRKRSRGRGPTTEDRKLADDIRRISMGSSANEDPNSTSTRAKDSQGRFLDALKAGAGIESSTLPVSSFDPGTSAAVNKAATKPSGRDLVAASPAVKAGGDDVVPTAEVNITINIQENGNTTQYHEFNTRDTDRYETSSTFQLGRIS